MRFLILGDLHGQLPKAHFKRFDAIIASGDFCSDAHRPYMFQAIKHRIATGEKIEWYDVVGKKKAQELIRKSVTDGRKVLEALNAFGVPVYVLPGNNDWTGYESKWKPEQKNHYKEMIKGLGNIVDVHERSIDIGDFILLGRGISSGPELPQYPDDKKQYTKTQLRKKEQEYRKLKKKMSVLFRDARKPVIFLSHNVPYNTKIDRILNKHSPRNGWHYGSLLARELVEEFQPVLCTGGHMHEHFGTVKIGKTVCLNAGYGSACNVLFEIDDEYASLTFKGRPVKY